MERRRRRNAEIKPFPPQSHFVDADGEREMRDRVQDFELSAKLFYPQRRRRQLVQSPQQFPDLAQDVLKDLRLLRWGIGEFHLVHKMIQLWPLPPRFRGVDGGSPPPLRLIRSRIFVVLIMERELNRVAESDGGRTTA